MRVELHNPKVRQVFKKPESCWVRVDVDEHVRRYEKPKHMAGVIKDHCTVELNFETRAKLLKFAQALLEMATKA